MQTQAWAHIGSLGRAAGITHIMFQSIPGAFTHSEAEECDLQDLSQMLQPVCEILWEEALN